MFRFRSTSFSFQIKSPKYLCLYVHNLYICATIFVLDIATVFCVEYTFCRHFEFIYLKNTDVKIATNPVFTKAANVYSFVVKSFNPCLGNNLLTVDYSLWMRGIHIRLLILLWWRREDWTSFFFCNLPLNWYLLCCSSNF